MEAITCHEVTMKPLFIFDFDDTIAHTKTNILVYHADGTTEELTSREFADYRREPGYQLDFSQFENDVEGALIHDTVEEMEHAIDSHGKNSVYIVTARHQSRPVVKFLKAYGINFPKVVAVTGSENKADWLRAMLVAGPWNEVNVWEDSMENIEMLQRVVEEFNKEFYYEGREVTFSFTHIQ